MKIKKNLFQIFHFFKKWNIYVALAFIGFGISANAQQQKIPHRFQEVPMPEQSLTTAKRITIDFTDAELMSLYYSDGMCRVEGGPDYSRGGLSFGSGKLLGFVDDKGNLALPFEYSSPNLLKYADFSDGVCAAYKYDLKNLKAPATLAYFDKSGKQLYSLEIFKQNGYYASHLFDYSQGVAIVITSKTNSPSIGLFVDKKGAVIPGSIKVENINSLFNWKGFNDGLAPMKDNELYYPKFGFVNTKGQWAIKPIYDKVKHFSDGLAAVMDSQSKRWGFIDTKGNVVVPFRFSIEPHDFHNGVCVVTNADYFDCIINKKGEVIFTGTRDAGQLGNFCPDMITLVGKQYLNNFIGIIDVNGNVLTFDDMWIFSHIDPVTCDIYDLYSCYRYDKASGIYYKSPKNLWLGRFSKEGLAPAIYTKDGKRYKGFVNRKYEFIVIFEPDQW